MNVIVMRGLPGSGKSTWIERNLHPASTIVSADNYFIKDGKYVFDKTMIGFAHADCFRRYIEMLQAGKVFQLVIDNTNIHAYEIAPYIQAANAYGVQSEIKYIYEEPKIAAERCIHGVPREVIFGMFGSLLRESLPSFWKQTIIY